MADPFPWHLVVLFEALTVCTCCPSAPFNFARKWIITPSAVAIALYLWEKSPVLEDKSVAYLTGFSLAFRLLFLTHTVYLQPGFPDYWRRVKDGDQLPSTFCKTKKISWMLSSAYGIRRVGWVQNPKGGVIPPPSSFRSRWAFVASRIVYTILSLAVLELTTLHELGNPAFDPAVHPSTDGSETYLRATSLVYRVLGVALWGQGLLNGGRALHFIASVICVGTGFSEIETWPDMVGPLAEAYSIRGYWGKTWHQGIRVPISGVAKYVAHNIINLAPGTDLSSDVQLLVAFGLSGLLHAGGDYMVIRHFPSFTVQFFLLQGMMVILESRVVRWTKPIHINGKFAWINRLIGFCWLASWVSFYGHLFLDPMSADGYTFGGLAFMWLRNFVRSRVEYLLQLL